MRSYFQISLSLRAGTESGKMESDAFGITEGPRGVKMTSKASDKRVLLSTASSSSVTVLVCALCALSLTASGYFSYRETLLESRLGALETQLAGMRATIGGGGDVVVERLRREVEARFQQRMRSEVASGRRLLMDVAASSMQHARAPREVSECSCPPGRENHHRHSLAPGKAQKVLLCPTGSAG